MKTLQVSDAKKFVRSRIDELAAQESDMMEIIADDRNLDSVIEKIMSEAVNDIHQMAPVSMLEGLSMQLDFNLFDPRIVDGVLDLKEIEDAELGETLDILRLVSFKDKGTGVLITSWYHEDSPMAKLQRNKYMRGTPNQPVLVKMADSEEWHPHLRFYTTGKPIEISAGIKGYGFELIYVPHQDNKEGDTSQYYVASELYTTVLNYLTGLVLTVYNNLDKAKVFLTKAKADMGIEE